ncbi:Uncharacterised protein [Metamycoplasma orale]|uniref:Uncharacterized protein n=1 Tax=Metamycoplasma orale TaxID=2121 RepID=A0A448ZWP3_METOS|nr:Uncharacterised protein [Metamycoplasma orale]
MWLKLKNNEKAYFSLVVDFENKEILVIRPLNHQI